MAVGMERFGATGGASSSPTKSEGDSAVLEGLVRAWDSAEKAVAVGAVKALLLAGHHFDEC